MALQIPGLVQFEVTDLEVLVVVGRGLSIEYKHPIMGGGGVDARSGFLLFPRWYSSVYIHEGRSRRSHRKKLIADFDQVINALCEKEKERQ